MLRSVQYDPLQTVIVFYENSVTFLPYSKIKLFNTKFKTRKITDIMYVFSLRIMF